MNLSTKRPSWFAKLGASVSAALLLVAAGCSSENHGVADSGALDASSDASAFDGGVEMTIDAAAERADDAMVTTDALSSDANTDGLGDGAMAGGGDGSVSDSGRDAVTDHGIAPAPCALCGLYAVFVPLAMQVHNLGFGQLQVDFTNGFQIFNGSAQRIPLGPVTFRYWFTTDNVSWQLQCGGNCGNVVDRGIHPIAPRSGADAYEEMAFTGGTLDAFSDTGLIVQDWNSLSNNAFLLPTINNDYSFSTPGQPDAHLTIYVDGKLVWGVEP